jgi:hypothetical protein
MCYSASSSFATFLIGFVFSIMLIQYGNPANARENAAFGMFFIFISLIQLMDFGFWMDLRNSVGLNHILTIIGPLLNAGQPLILYLIKLAVLTPATYDVPILTMNVAYGAYLARAYYRFITNEKTLTTTTENGHLKWRWIDYVYPIFYLVSLTVNLFYLTDFAYSRFTFILTALFMVLSVRYFPYRVGEMWCFFGAFMPLIVFAYQMRPTVPQCRRMFAL